MKKALFLLALGSGLYAQSTILAYRATVGNTVTTLGDTGSITYNAEAIGRPLDGTIQVTNRGTNPINILRIELTGSTDFSVNGVPAETSTFAVNDGFTVTLRYRPSSGNRATGNIRFVYQEVPQGRPVINGTSSLSLSGVAPDFTLAYLPPPSSNATPIASGGTIAFPATAVNDTSTAVVVITNRGSGPGTVGDIVSSGSASFSLASLPSPPTTVDASREVRFSIRYQPTAIESATGNVTIAFVDRTVSFNLTGSSTGATFGYELLSDSGGGAGLRPGATVPVPDAAVGEKSTVTVRVRNTGNADGRITVIGVQGAGFTITDSPFLPTTLTPGAAATVQVTFTPTQPGRATGRLRIGDDSFDVVSNGLGPNVTYSFVAGPVTTTITNNGTITFPPAAVGGTSTVRLVVTNTGTLSSAVNSVSVVTTNNTFTVASPSLPATLAPNQTLTFTLTFAPTSTGSQTGTIRVDSQTFNLTAVATAPPNLPAYSFTGATGAQQAASQLAVGLTLAQAYPLTLRGVLTLGFNSDVFSNDPAVQFALGGRTVNFTIPAGQREAVFPSNVNTVRLQTGTVAGNIVLTPSFNTDAGIILTPTDPPSLTLSVAQGAPRLLTAQLTGRTTTGYSLLVTGYTTARQITTIDLQITPTAGENVTTSRISIPADASFTAWYQGTASAAFGSQFTATIPLTIQGDVTNVTSLADTIKSVAVTLTNRLGSSQTVTAEVQQ